MLHILWMIIKFILILIGIILGLILLALLLILFCPVRYQAEGSKEAGSFRTASGRAKVSWLFGGISVSLGFQNGQTTSDFRLFGIPVMKVLKKLKSRKKQKKPDFDLDDDAEYSETDEGRTGNESYYIEAKEKNPEASPDETKSSRGEPEIPQVSWPEMGTVEEDLSDSEAERERKWQQTVEKLKNLFYNLGNKVRRIWDKIKAVCQRILKIPEDLENLSRKKDALCARIDWWKAFIEHPRTQKALTLVKDKAFQLLRHIFPTKINGELTFDCTDPSITGTVLAVLGMTIPLHRNCIRVTPLFENRNILYGNAKIKGRVYGVMLIKTAIDLYFDKNIKYVIRRWKHK